MDCVNGVEGASERGTRWTLSRGVERGGDDRRGAMAAGDGKEDAGAVVVGGGPAGLAVALSLASLGYDKVREVPSCLPPLRWHLHRGAERHAQLPPAHRRPSPRRVGKQEGVCLY